MGRSGRAVIILILASSMLAGCGTVRESRFNPFNWFGRSVSEPVAAEGDVNPLIPARRASILRDTSEPVYAGTRVGEVTELLIERRPGGAIIRASGVADYQGPYEVRLTPVEEETGNGTLTYALRAVQTPGPRNSDRSRTVTAAVWKTDNELAGIGTIRVLGNRNARAARR